MRLVLLIGAALAGLSACAGERVSAVRGPKAVLRGSAERTAAVAFSPDGKTIAGAGKGSESGDGEVKLWTASTGVERAAFSSHTSGVSALEFSADGRRLAVGGRDGRIVLLDAETGARTLSIAGPPGPVLQLTFSFEGNLLTSITRVERAPSADEAEPTTDVELRRWDLATGEVRGTYTARRASAAALSREGRTLARNTLGENGAVRILDFETQKDRTVARVELEGDDPLVYSPDGKWLGAVHRQGWSPIPNRCSYVYLIDATAGQVRLRSPRLPDARRGLAFSHDGKLFARGIEGGLQLWDLATRREIATVANGSGEGQDVDLLAFSPDDRFLVSSDGSGALSLWDVADLLKPASP